MAEITIAKAARLPVLNEDEMCKQGCWLEIVSAEKVGGVIVLKVRTAESEIKILEEMFDDAQNPELQAGAVALMLMERMAFEIAKEMVPEVRHRLLAVLRGDADEAVPDRSKYSADH